MRQGAPSGSQRHDAKLPHKLPRGKSSDGGKGGIGHRTSTNKAIRSLSRFANRICNVVKSQGVLSGLAICGVGGNQLFGCAPLG
jgi:hypothetical protein